MWPVKVHRKDLAKLVAYARPACDAGTLDHVGIRGFLAQLYSAGLSKSSVARHLAALRSLFRWMAQEGIVESNPALLVATPRLPRKLPRVPTVEEMNTALDSAIPKCSSFPERDALIFELLYGCGIRNAELVAMNLDDISSSNELILGFHTTDVDALAARALAAGGTLMRETQDFPHLGVRVAFIADLEGHQIEVVQVVE